MSEPEKPYTAKELHGVHEVEGFVGYLGLADETPIAPDKLRATADLLERYEAESEEMADLLNRLTAPVPSDSKEADFIGELMLRRMAQNDLIQAFLDRRREGQV